MWIIANESLKEIQRELALAKESLFRKSNIPFLIMKNPYETDFQHEMDDFLQGNRTSIYSNIHFAAVLFGFQLKLTKLPNSIDLCVTAEPAVKFFVVVFLCEWKTNWFDTFPNTRHNCSALSTLWQASNFTAFANVSTHHRFCVMCMDFVELWGNWNQSTLSTMKT